MPPYVSTPGMNSPVLTLQRGITGYAFGSKNVNKPTVKMFVSSVAVLSNVVTLGVTLVEGFIPAVGDLISVVGTSTDSGVANVSNIALASVSIAAATGIGTVTYAATGSNQSTTPDSGTANVSVGEVAEALTNSTSQAFAIPEQNASDENGLTFTWSVNYPTNPSAVTMSLQAAMVNQDSQYETLDSSTVLTEEIRSITLTRYRFVRVQATNVTGSSPTAVVRFDI